MPKAGTFAALQQLRPIEADFGKILKEEEAKQFKRGQLEGARKVQAKTAREKKLADDLKAVNSLYDEVDIEGIDVSHIGELDRVNSQSVDDAMTLKQKIHKRAISDPNGYGKSAEFRNTLQNLDRAIPDILAMQEGIISFGQRIQEKELDGTASLYDKDRNQQLSVLLKNQEIRRTLDPETGKFRTYALKRNPETNEVLFNEDGTKQVYEVRLEDIVNGTGLFEISENIDATKEASNLAKTLGESTRVTGGRTLTTVQSFDTANVDGKFNESIDTRLGNKNIPSNLAKSIWANIEGNEGITFKNGRATEEQFKQIKGTFTELVRNSYDKTTQKKFAPLAPTKTELKRGTSTPQVVVNPTTGVPVSKEIEGVKGFTTSLNPNPVFVTKTNTEAVHVQNITILENGEIHADVTTLVRGTGGAVVKESGEIDYLATAFAKAGWEQKVEENKKLDATFLGNLSTNKVLRDDKGGTFKNGKELADFLKKKFKEQSGGQPLKSSKVDTSKYN